jgi:hypothetical protein
LPPVIVALGPGVDGVAAEDDRKGSAEAVEEWAAVLPGVPGVVVDAVLGSCRRDKKEPPGMGSGAC